MRERLLGASGACLATTEAKQRPNRSSPTGLELKKTDRMNILSVFLMSVRERIRTPDTLVRSQVLYPAELHTHILF